MKQNTNGSSTGLLKKHKKLLVGLVILAFTAVIFFMNQTNQPPHIKQSQFIFAYGETIPTNSDAYLSYGSHYQDTAFDPELFAMSEIGDYEVEVEFAQERYTLNIAIVDDKAPLITFEDTSMTIYEYNGKMIMKDAWKIEDDSGFTIAVEPAIEEIKTGSQELCVTAIDDYKNAATVCKTLKVERKALALPKIPKVQDVKALVEEFIRQKHLSSSSFAFFYDSPDDDETYIYNGNRLVNAASTIKVPLNMLYEDAYVEGTKKAEDTIIFIKSDIEVGDGDTQKKHRTGDAISYAYLQKQSIEKSDNTATNMLVRGLGGFYKFREQLVQYTTKALPKEFYRQNVVTMDYMHDVMKTLYQNQKKYAKIIGYMKNAAVGSFLQESTDVFEIAQKYGQYDVNLHAVGIVYTPLPYLVGIYTMNRVDAEAIICELNQWLIAYQLSKE